MNKREVAERLGISTRLVEKYSGEGRLGEVRYVRGKTGRQADYDEQAVEKLKAELEAPAFPPNQSAALVPAAQSREAGLFMAQLLAVLQDRAQSPEQTRTGHFGAAIGEKILLTLADASALTSLSTGHLREAIRAGKLKAKIIGRGYKIKRADLDAYVKKL